MSSGKISVPEAAAKSLEAALRHMMLKQLEELINDGEVNDGDDVDSMTNTYRKFLGETLDTVAAEVKEKAQLVLTDNEDKPPAAKPDAKPAAKPDAKPAAKPVTKTPSAKVMRLDIKDTTTDITDGWTYDDEEEDFFGNTTTVSSDDEKEKATVSPTLMDKKAEANSTDDDDDDDDDDKEEDKALVLTAVGGAKKDEDYEEEEEEEEEEEKEDNDDKKVKAASTLMDNKDEAMDIDDDGKGAKDPRSVFDKVGSTTASGKKQDNENEDEDDEEIKPRLLFNTQNETTQSKTDKTKEMKDEDEDEDEDEDKDADDDFVIPPFKYKESRKRKLDWQKMEQEVRERKLVSKRKRECIEEGMSEEEMKPHLTRKNVRIHYAKERYEKKWAKFAMAAKQDS